MNAYMQKRKNIGICFAFEAKLFCCFFSEETQKLEPYRYTSLPKAYSRLKTQIFLVYNYLFHFCSAK